jgi:hypothetical protein
VANSEGSRSNTVTCTPRRRNAWAISVPIAPPPRIANVAGGASRVNRFSLVRQASGESPSIAGTSGLLPVQSNTNRVESTRTAPSAVVTSTSVGEVSRADPLISSTPISA